MNDQLKKTAQKHWPTALIVTILLGMTAYLSQDKLQSFSDADAKLLNLNQQCLESIKNNRDKLGGLERRVDHIESILPYTTEAIKKNTETTEMVREEVQRIRILIERNLGRIPDDR